MLFYPSADRSVSAPNATPLRWTSVNDYLFVYSPKNGAADCVFVRFKIFMPLEKWMWFPVLNLLRERCFFWGKSALGDFSRLTAISSD
jgi:hypothetical protein